ncbi:hypothetical protein [Burkholderia ambifaria]|uniref:hypothetical protein n=1 Tax=Burkholderia ambifaria TaxID=152480 RepID=UPI000A84CC47|nr:hypothetical protein [Burkholderia ambifaria]
MVGLWSWRPGRPFRLVLARGPDTAWIHRTRTGCAFCRAAGRDIDIDNGNTAAIIASRIEGVAPVQPGQRAEKSGGGIATHCHPSPPIATVS